MAAPPANQTSIEVDNGGNTIKYWDDPKNFSQHMGLLIGGECGAVVILIFCAYAFRYVLTDCLPRREEFRIWKKMRNNGADAESGNDPAMLGPENIEPEGDHPQQKKKEKKSRVLVKKILKIFHGSEEGSSSQCRYTIPLLFALDPSIPEMQSSLTSPNIGVSM